MQSLNTLTQGTGIQKQVIISLMIIVMAFSALLFYYESNREERVYEDVYESIQQSSLNSANKLTKDINNFKKHIQLLSELPYIQDFIDISNQSPSPENTTIKHKINRIFKALLKQEDNIRQARLILKNGNEFARVDRNQSGIVATPANLLQSKLDRDYFKAGITLLKDELYVSDISPNYEHGQIEIPLWPTYRIIKSLRNSAGDVQGILILNIDASNSLRGLNNQLLTNTNIAELDFFLINQDGFYVAAPNEQFLFGRDLDKPQMNWFVHTQKNTPLSNNYRFKTKFNNKPYVFYSKEFTLSSNNKTKPYYLVVGTTEDKVNSFIETQRKELFISIFGFACLIALIIYLSLRHIKNLETLYLNQSQFKAIISNSSDAILSINQSGYIQSWNQASSLLFGLKEADALGASFFNLVDADEHFNEQYLAHILQANVNKRIEVNLKTPSNQKRILLLTLGPIQKKDGNNESIALIIRDITFQKENQAKLEAANENLDSEVKKRTDQLETEKQKAIKANNIKSMFVANISHEIRTPLNGISGLLTLARDKENIDKQDSYLKMAQDSAQSLNILINDLLDLSKIESGKLELSPSSTDLSALLESVISSVYFLIKDKDIELLLDTSKLKINHLIVDNNRLKQVLTNLLSNAIKFTKQGEVVLTASNYYDPNNKNKVICEFQVYDTGMGIPIEQQAKLFTPFVQASSGIANKYGGTGLGLSISKQLCEMMGGNITFDSQSGEGSTFKATVSAHMDDTLENIPFTASINCEGKNIAILVAANLLHRILRNHLNTWKANVIPIKNMSELKTLIRDKHLDSLISDTPILEPSLAKQLATLGTSIMYVSSKEILKAAPLNGKVLSQPILPSFIAKHLFNVPATEIKDEEAGENDAVQKQAKAVTPPSTTNSNMLNDLQKVFIVDDNTINQIVAKGILKSLNVTIETASNGQEIIESLRALEQSETLPVILMDCQMPVMNGFDAARAVRRGDAGDWLKSAPIIALTADAMDQNLEDCKAAGMNDFLGKPFDPDVLKERVLHWASQK